MKATEMSETLTGTLIRSYYPKAGKEGWIQTPQGKTRTRGPQVCIIRLTDGRKVWGISPVGLPQTSTGYDTTKEFSITVHSIDWNAAGDFGFYVIDGPIGHFAAHYSHREG